MKLNLLKSFFVSYRFCGFRKAFLFPVFVDYGCNIKINKHARIIIDSPVKTRLIHFKESFFKIDKNCTMIIKGKVRFNGLNLFMLSEATVIFGNNFNTNGNCSFNIAKRVTFGNNVLFSANALVYDTDFHSIYNEKGEIINKNKDIIIGNNVWFGNRVTILKGTLIADNTIFGAGALISGCYTEQNAIYTGFPAKLVKQGVTWDYNMPQ